MNAFLANKHFIGFEKNTISPIYCKVLILMKLSVLSGNDSLPGNGLNLLSFKKLCLLDDYIIWTLLTEN